MGTISVNNVPEYAKGKWIVARIDAGELWFWGAWDDEEKAKQVATDLEESLVVKYD